MATKKTTKRTPKVQAPTVSKTEFVMSLPQEMSAEDVVAKALDAGLDISKAYVYTIRTNARAKNDPGRVRKRGTPQRSAGTDKAFQDALERLIDEKVSAAIQRRFTEMFGS